MVFDWRTRDADIKDQEQADTTYIFNKAKMYFNHLAELYGGKPIAFKTRYLEIFTNARQDPHRMAQRVLRLMAELERRLSLGDDRLTESNRVLYAELRRQIVPSGGSLLSAEYVDELRRSQEDETEE